MITSHTRACGTAVVAAGVAVVVLVGCGSSGSVPGSMPPATHGTTTHGRIGAPPTTDAATVAAVKSAYAKFFDPKTPEATSLSLLQDGAAFKSAVQSQSKGSLAQNSAATVSKVTLQSPNTAKVVFTILVNGKAMLPDQPGYAVREGGTWKVAGQTFCGLLTLQGSPPPACKSPTATSLPD
ncbi:MAG: hypothetical protein ACRDWT_03215 [Jatrophihabitantaceae bacterium]